MTLLLTSVNQTLAPSADQARQQFAIVPAYLVKKASPAALKVYGALALRVDHDTGICWPSHARIVTDTGLCRSTVIRALGELVKLGAIERDHRKTEEGDYTSNLYRLAFAINRPASEQTEGGSAKFTPPSAKFAPGVVQKTAHKPDSVELEARAEAESSERELAAANSDPFTVWAEQRCEKRGGGPGLLKKILAEDYDIWQREHAAADLPNPSPDRNHPGTCPHLAVDTEGWCAACMTQPQFSLRREISREFVDVD